MICNDLIASRVVYLNNLDQRDLQIYQIYYLIRIINQGRDYEEAI